MSITYCTTDLASEANAINGRNFKKVMLYFPLKISIGKSPCIVQDADEPLKVLEGL